MNFTNKFSIKARMTISLLLLVIIFTVSGIFLISGLIRLGNLTFTLYNHPLRVSNASLSANLGVIKMHRSMKDVAMSRSGIEIDHNTDTVIEEEKNVYEQFDIIDKHILGDEGKKLARAIRINFRNWKPIRNEVIALVKNGDRQGAGLITRGKGADYVSYLETEMKMLVTYARNKADGFMVNADKIKNNTIRNTIMLIITTAVISMVLGFVLLTSILKDLNKLKLTMSEISKSGELVKAELQGNNEIVELGSFFNMLIDRLKEQFWLKDGLNELNKQLSGMNTFEELLEKSINNTSRYTEACAGALYLYNEDESVHELKSSFAPVKSRFIAEKFQLKEGIVGQVAHEKKPVYLTDISPDIALIKSGTVSKPPNSIYAVPLMVQDEFYGVFEIASFNKMDDLKLEFLDKAGEVISFHLYTAINNNKISNLLHESHKLNEEISYKSNELNSSNQELQALNDELTAQSQELESQTIELRTQTNRLEEQREMILEADRLKSEFLSNMSHELRTPLNSVLALSQLMISQSTGIDMDKEREYLEVIERNGRLLLSLINNILDLSKIESGKMDIFITEIKPSNPVNAAIETIIPLAEKKGLEIIIDIEDGLLMKSDEEKVAQILLNIFSNAVKFTAEGSINVRVSRDNEKIKFSVKDTGIGIDEEDLPLIFDQFRQIDGSTAREHEGTGLGLAISKKLAEIIGGTILAESKKDAGSTFTLTLPVNFSKGDSTAKITENTGSLKVYKANNVLGKDTIRKTVLVIDDDPEFCSMIKDYLKDEGYRAVTKNNGVDGLAHAREIIPFAIILDILMPGLDGFEVLKGLKETRETIDIPVIIASKSKDRETGIALGASAYLLKPVDRLQLLREIRKAGMLKKTDNILIVDDDPAIRIQLRKVLQDVGYNAKTASSGEEALRLINTSVPDLLILDLLMPGMDGFTMLHELRNKFSADELPVFILTSKDLTAQEKSRLMDVSQRIFKKGSMDMDGILNKIDQSLQSIKRIKEISLRIINPVILLIEDNEIAEAQIRLALEENDYEVHSASNGLKSLNIVEKIIPDAIILDLMMPGMDGFQVLEQVRSTPETAAIPVIVLTAKEITAEDRSRLSKNNVQQLIQKGSLNKDQLISRINKLFQFDQVEIKAGEDNSKIIPPDPEGKKIVPVKKVKDPVILIIEDNKDNLVTITAILETNGYRYLIASNGTDGLEITKEKKPGLILMDIQLPGLNGLDATKEIKSDTSVSHIPVIALTARAMAGDREEILNAGCNDYLSKPYNPSDLIKILKKWSK